MNNKKIYLKCANLFAAMLLVGFITLVTCAAVSVMPKLSGGKPKMDQTKLQPVTPGNLGATGVNVVIEKKKVSIQFDCAEGEILQPLMVDKKGSFKVDGFYKRGSFGPIRMNNLPKFVPARYEGKITGKVMKFKVSLIDTNEVIGEFTLERGKTGRLHRCL